jgi:GNAT superfamily N-acetyltransferase
MIEFRSLRQDELDAWFEHCVYVFGNGISDPVLKGLFINHYYMDPDRDLEGILVAVLEGQILSTVRIFYRTAYFFGKEIRVGGIGEVSTRAEYQGKGLAYHLLEDAIQQMKDREVDISMLRGTSGIYSKLGWRKTTTYTQVSKLVESNELPYRMRPVDFDHEIPLLKAIHKEYSEKFNGAFTRDDYYWRYWVKMEGRNVWVIEDNNDKVIGYICFQYIDSCIHIDEFCVLFPYESIFDQVVGKLCSMMGRAESEIKFSSLVQSGMKADRMEKGEYNMYRLIKPFSIGEEVIESTERLVDRLIGAETDNPVSDILFWGIDSF